MINEAFCSNAIVPNIIDVAPSKTLEVKYSEVNKEVQLGAELRLSDTIKAPDIQYAADSDGFYTLLMIDPDAPGRKMSFLGEIQHWTVVNIPSDRVAEGQVLKGYAKAGAPRFTGLHRYIFLVFKQPEKLTFNESISDSLYSRSWFSTKKFIKKYNLGNPVAGNFFLAQY